MQKQQVHPLEAVYAAATQGKGSKQAPKDEFFFDFTYPGKFSHLRGARFETYVEWEGDANTLVVNTSIRGVTFRPWPTIETFLRVLNIEIHPYLDDSFGKGYIWAAPLGKEDEKLLSPIFGFRIACERIQEHELQQVFLRMLFDRAALALWLSRTVFRHISKKGKEPDALERMRLLSREHGKFSLNVVDKKGEGEDGEDLPPRPTFSARFL